MTKKGSSSSGGGSLEALLERKVSGWIDQFYSGGQERLAPLDEQDALVAYIHGRDASWKRKPEKKLRQLIERVVSRSGGGGRFSSFAVNDDNADDAASDTDSVDVLEPNVEYIQVKNSNSLNKSLLGVYSKMDNQHQQQQQQQLGINSPSVDTITNGISAIEKINNIPSPLLATSASSINLLHSSSSSISTVATESNSTTTTMDETVKKRQRTSNTASSFGGGSKKQRQAKDTTSPSNVTVSTARLSDLGGIDDCIEDVLQLIGMPLKHPEVYAHLGIQPPRGILLHGPPGCGKTMLANAIAGEVGVPFISISAPSVVSGMSGESEKKIREVFEEAKESAPCLLFIDEIDAITPKRETAQREMERRIVAQLLTCMDDLSLEKTNNKPVLIIGATNRPDALDPALRRAGRFDREISMGVPDEKARARILEKMSIKLRLAGDFDFNVIAKLTPGYVGADLKALTAEAGMIAVKRIVNSLRPDASISCEEGSSTVTMMDMDDEEPSSDYNQPQQQSIETSITTTRASSSFTTTAGLITDFLESHKEPLSENQLESLNILNDDFLAAIKIVQPSAKREGFATVPDICWDDIGALEPIREELRMAVVEPIRSPDSFKRVGITAPCGVLLYGPPGCGKTLLAKAVANESLCNFISVKGPELLNKYVGESERAVRQVFSRAQASSPCVIFFDELDALCPSRSNDSESQHSSRLVNTLLTEMDGMQGRKQVYVIAATNRPDMIDPAMLRPGRLDKALYVDLPTASERHEILKTLCRKTPLDSSCNLLDISNHAKCDGLSGADLAALVREASVMALRKQLFSTSSPNGSTGGGGDDGKKSIFVTADNFASAFAKLVPSVSKKDRRKYELLKVRFGKGATIEEKEIPTKEE